MKFYFSILLLFFLLSGNSYSKILNINDDFKIEVPNNFNIKKIENIVDQLKLNDLYKAGVLTKEEFEKAKKKILN